MFLYFISGGGGSGEKRRYGIGLVNHVFRSLSPVLRNPEYLVFIRVRIRLLLGPEPFVDLLLRSKMVSEPVRHVHFYLRLNRLPS